MGSHRILFDLLDIPTENSNLSSLTVRFGTFEMPDYLKNLDAKLIINIDILFCVTRFTTAIGSL